LAQAEIRSQHYTRDPSLDNKVSNTSVLGEHQSLSLIQCAAKCGDHCSFFGFNVQQRRCRLHQTCDSADMTMEEAGWRYYSPAGMLSYIPYSMLEMSIWCIKICTVMFFIFLISHSWYILSHCKVYKDFFTDALLYFFSSQVVLLV
jgi:hypothetical protein